jgi:hypothetical protein
MVSVVVGRWVAIDAKGKSSDCDAKGKSSDFDAKGKSSDCDAKGKSSDCDAKGKSSDCDAKGKSSDCDATSSLGPNAGIEVEIAESASKKFWGGEAKSDVVRVLQARARSAMRLRANVHNQTQAAQVQWVMHPVA